LTAKDKAKELVDMIDDIRMSEESAIESALICVDEILESLWNVGHSSSNDEIKYWQEVKQEINKL
jgi:hypothetical protein